MLDEKVLFVLTSHDKKGKTGDKTGFYLSEASHAWKVLTDNRHEIDFVSPQGGEPPVEGLDLDDEVNKAFWEDEDYRAKLKNTQTPEEVDVSDYIAIYFVGGHGTMWDFPDNEKLAEITAQIYEKGGFVSGVCHGPSGLVNVQLSDGNYLVDGKEISAFTNQEEREVGLDEVVPFLLEDKLLERGATIRKTKKFGEMISAHDRLITGQNPASAKKVGQALNAALQTLFIQQD